MKTALKRTEFPELFYGIVAPIGVDTAAVLGAIHDRLTEVGYSVELVKVTDAFKFFERKFIPWTKLIDKNYQSRLDTYIKYGNQIRMNFDDGAILAASSIFQISKLRGGAITKGGDPSGLFSGPPDPGAHIKKKAYIISQFKREEEVELFRSVYGNLFSQISIYSRRENRIDWLSRKFASENADADFDSYREIAEAFVKRDFNERSQSYGQRVSKIFHNADLIVNIDVERPSVRFQVNRFIDLQFGANFHSPTRYEYGMFAAKAAALRSLDLSRQVGAAIFSKSSEIITLGCNEVPKGGGGPYWAGDDFDNREYKRRADSNDMRKREIVKEIYDALVSEGIIESEEFLEFFRRKKISDSRLMDALEYGRIIHAEMNAITDAARLGRVVQDSTLYCTTFPCHMCAKHIVSSGVRDVVFLEPYPKSLARDLHADSIRVEGGDRAIFNSYPAVEFVHFYGVTPRSYRDLFERTKRKDKNSVFEDYIDGEKAPNIDNTLPYYVIAEAVIIRSTLRKFRDTRRVRPPLN